jgi:hypothetical protein
MCHTCRDTANFCLTCSEEESNRILPSCDCPAKHLDDGNAICLECYYGCKTCSGTISQCTSCIGTTRKTNNYCICLDGFWDDYS